MSNCSGEDSSENQTVFVKIIKQYPVLLEKSNIPEVKNKRRKAVEEIKEKLEAELGVKNNEGQIWKKIQNLKTRLKAKTDRNQTGNKPIKLKGWEQELFNFLQGESNPTITRLQGAVSAGCSTKSVEDDISITRASVSSAVEETDETDFNKVASRSSGSVLQAPTFKAGPSKKNPEKKGKRGLVETDETRDLSLTELQRLVLLEQLQVFRLAKELLLEKKNANLDQNILDLNKNEETENPILISLFPGNI